MCKTFFRILMALCLTLPLWAQAQSCDDIKDSDKANYCRAINSNDAKFCHKINDNDTQNLCLGKVENNPKYCKRISLDKIKKRCENSLR